MCWKLYLLKFFWNLLAAVNNCFIVVFFLCTLLWGPWHSRSSLPGRYSFTSSSSWSNILSFPPNLNINEINAWMIMTIVKMNIPLLLSVYLSPGWRYHRWGYWWEKCSETFQITTSCSQEIPSTLSEINCTMRIWNICYFFFSSYNWKICSCGPLHCESIELLLLHCTGDFIIITFKFCCYWGIWSSWFMQSNCNGTRRCYIHCNQRWRIRRSSLSKS